MSEITMSEVYILPSLGKIYDVEVNPNIELRSMTTAEEMRRLSHTDRPYQLLSEIIDDCMVKKPGISSYDMCLGDYTFLLHKLRIVTYGTEYKTVTTCPYCGATNNKSINLDSLEVHSYSDDIKDLMYIELPKTKKQIQIRMQTPRMLDDISMMAKEHKKRAPNFVGDPAFLFLLKKIIGTVDGVQLDPIKQEDFITKLPMQDTNYILQISDKLNEKVGIQSQVEFGCSLCGLDYTVPFRFTTEFFRPSI